MNKITQDIAFRQSLLNYAEKYGVTAAARKYKVNRQYIYRWKRRYDGTPESLANQSRRPHHHPKQHTPEEIKLITDMHRRNPNDGLVIFWVKLKGRGYSRSVTSLYRVLKRLGIFPAKLPNPKYVPKQYEQMTYPGQRIQIDVKVVPSSCIVGEAKGRKFYQYTAIDEFSRFRYLEAFEEQNTYSSAIFVKSLIRKFPFKIECIQTDNGTEFTNHFNTRNKRETMFEKVLQENNIQHKLIRPFTPRHNGKVERSHRKDNENFYAKRTFYSFNDLCKQLAVYNRYYNNFPMRPLLWKSPRKTLFDFLLLGVTYV